MMMSTEIPNPIVVVLSDVLSCKDVCGIVAMYAGPLYLPEYTPTSADAVEIDLSLRDASFTLMAWVCPQEPHYGMLMSQDRCCVEGNQFRFEFYYSGRFALANMDTNMTHGRIFGDSSQWAPDLCSQTSLPLKIWSHIVVTRHNESGCYKLLLNGRVESEVKCQGFHCINSKESFRIGSRHPPNGQAAHNRFKGSVAGALFFDDATSETDVQKWAVWTQPK